MKAKAILTISVLALAFSLASARAEMVCEDPVEISAGRVRGTVDEGACGWRGVPYAAPPTADLRWKAPRPAPGWEGVRDAVEFGPPCVQYNGLMATMDCSSFG